MRNNQNSEKVMFRKYFSDYYKWIICVTVLFVIIYILELAGVWSISWGRYWFIPTFYLVLLLIIFRYHVLFFAAIEDIKRNHIEETPILIQEVERDRKFNFFNNGGAMIGKEKCILIDSDGNKYRVVINQDFIVEMRPQEYYKDAQIIVKYLSKSRIVLHMKLKSSKSSNGAALHFHKDFQDYF